MIIKSFEIIKNPQILDQKKINLFYGINLGLKNDIKNIILKNLKKKSGELEVIVFDEEQILKNNEKLFSLIWNKSLFEQERVIIINQISEKFLKIMEELIKKEIDISIILIAEILEKKSKIRFYCEKNNKISITACYEDSFFDLEKIAKNKFKENNINITNEIINSLVLRANGDRNNLYNEIIKIKSYLGNNNKITFEKFKILTNSNEKIKADNLINNCLSGNKYELKKNLSEIYLDSFDYIWFLKILSMKIQRLVRIKNLEKESKNYETLINNLKPPVFWKEKPILKQQLMIWKIENLDEIIAKINQIELDCKKNNEISSIIFLNFFNNICIQANNSSL